MLYLPGIRRTTLAAAVLVIVLDVLLVVMAVTTYVGGTATSTVSDTTSTTRTVGGVVTTTPPLASTRSGAQTTKGTQSPPPRDKYLPLRVAVPPSAVQQAVDESMAQGSRAGVALLEKALVVTPATSAHFPAVDAADSSSASLFAMAFTQELLDLDFRATTRTQLLAWAQFNDAPYSLGDVRASLGARVLVTSLTSGSSPVPSTVEWSHLARSRVNWRVSGLVVSVNPTWTQALSAGWVPTDSLMGIYDVSGLLTIISPGHSVVTKSVAFALTLGGAGLHPGYGAVALDDWTVN
ncbi:MAG: hypothetical protein HKL85_09215 [Acidimicrobiaceae bacterium]|nr:hypothetical protein [Acidimicrobiaceae bacterium]